MATSDTDRYSDLAVHPGGLLGEEIRARGFTQKDFAQRIHRPPQAVSEIVKGKKAITADTALALEEAFGDVSAAFWLRLQAEYDLAVARARRGEPLAG